MINACLSRCRITSAEQVEMVQFVVKVVKRLTNLEARVERKFGVVGFMEFLGKAPEHIGEG